MLLLIHHQCACSVVPLLRKFMIVDLIYCSTKSNVDFPPSHQCQSPVPSSCSNDVALLDDVERPGTPVTAATLSLRESLGRKMATQSVNKQKGEISLSEQNNSC